MAFIAIIPMLLLAVFAFLTIANPALHAQIQETLLDTGTDAKVLGTKVLKAYEIHLQPRVRKFAYVSYAMLIVGGAIFPMVCAASNGRWSYIMLLPVTAGCMIGILRVTRRTDAEFSAFDLLGAIIGSFVITGCADLCMAVVHHDTDLAVIGAIFMYLAFQLTFFAAELGARLAALGVDVLEGTLGKVKIFASALMTMDMKSAMKEADKHPVNISDQEKYVGYVQEAHATGKHILYPALLLTVLLPFPYIFALNAIAGTAIFLSRTYLESKGIDTVERQKFRARFLEALTLGLVVLTGLRYIWPHHEELLAFFPEARGVYEWCASFLYNLYTVLNIWWMVGGLVFALVASALLDPGEGEGFFYRARQVMAGSMVVVQFICTVMIVFAMFVKAHAKAESVTLTQVSVMVDTMTPPTAQVTTDKTSGKPTVTVTWKDFPQAVQYQVLRTGPGAKEYVPLAIPVMQGMQSMDDAGPFIPGAKYAYRLMAKLPHGELKPSEPVRVLIPLPPPPPEETSTPTSREAGAATATTAQQKTGDDMADNPYLAAYCKRHPSACSTM